MELATHKKQIIENQISNLYIYVGDEWQIEKIYINQLATATKKEVRYVDKLTDIIHRLQNVSLVPASYLYVIMEDTEIITQEKLYTQLPGVLKNDMLILKYTKLDTRTKFYNQFKEHIVEFKALSKEILYKYIKKELNVNKQDIEYLAEACEYNYGRVLLEIDKVKHYDKDIQKSFDVLADAGLINYSPQDMAFEFINAALLRKPTLAFALKEKTLEYGGNVLALMSLLYTNVRNLLQVVTCTSDDIEKSTGLQRWQINNAMKYKNVFSEDELIDILWDIQKCQKGIVTGTIEEKYVLDYILIRMF